MAHFLGNSKDAAESKFQRMAPSAMEKNAPKGQDWAPLTFLDISACCISKFLGPLTTMTRLPTTFECVNCCYLASDLLLYIWGVGGGE